MTDVLTLELGDGRRCPVHLGAGALEALPICWEPGWREAALIGDANVLALHGEAVAARLRPLVSRLLVLDFPPGEAAKTRETKARLEDALLDAAVGRDACVVALGGGISLDLAGFVAATYLRGVPHLNLPTSLLAMVDAAVGGKTGVNTRHGKNLIGAFQQPAAVLVEPALLATLPPAEWPSGLAEVLKHGVIADLALLAWLEAHARELRCPGALDPYPLRRCLELKAAVVAEDEREGGRRAILNFGHTIGHALERATGHALGHGEAVAVGMRVEARVARRRAGLPAEDEARLAALLQALGLPARWPGVSFEQLAPALAVDKKRQGGAARLALPARLGEMARDGEAWTLAVPLDELRRAWEAE